MENKIYTKEQMDMIKSISEEIKKLEETGIHLVYNYNKGKILLIPDKEVTYNGKKGYVKCENEDMNISFDTMEDFDTKEKCDITDELLNFETSGAIPDSVYSYEDVYSFLPLKEQ